MSNLSQCQADFLFSRQYNEDKTSVVYTCQKIGRGVAYIVDEELFLKENICNLDKEAFKFFENICERCCCKSNYAGCIA